MMTKYENVVRALYKVNSYQPAKMGLNNITALHKLLGRPMDGMLTIHIAGTNGKGSVALKMARALELAGYRTGLFVSPHVSCFRERVQVDQQLISEEDVVSILPKIFDLCRTEGIPATFFELTTAIAFAHFREQNAQIVVVEAGLGGKMDATNIITPCLSIITSVGLDHTHILGNTIEAIATDKAGIIKPNIPVLVGDNCPHELLKGIAHDRKSPYYRVSDIQLPSQLDNTKTDKNRTENTETSHHLVDYDLENSRIAAAGLHILDRRAEFAYPVPQMAIESGIGVRPPCRFEEIHVHVPNAGHERTVHVVLDVAHNPPAMECLLHKLHITYGDRPLRFVLAVSSDKDARGIVTRVVQACGSPDRVHFTKAPHPRGTPVEKLVEIMKSIAPEGWTYKWRQSHIGVREGLREALDLVAAEGGDDVIVVCGTVFMMTDARQELGFQEPQDSPIIAELAGHHFRATQDNLNMTNDTITPDATKAYTTI